MKAAVFFDLDDTLLDNFQAFFQTLSASFPEERISKERAQRDYQSFRFHSNQIFQAYHAQEIAEVPTDYRWRKTFKHLAFTSEEVVRLENTYHHYQSQLTLSPAVRQKLIQLKEKGLLLGIITNGLSTTQQRKIQQLNLRAFVEPTAIFVSEALQLAKPDPAIFTKVEALLHLEQHPKYYIGDSLTNDVLPLLESNWQPLWLNQFQEKSEVLVNTAETLTEALDFVLTQVE